MKGTKKVQILEEQISITSGTSLGIDATDPDITQKILYQLSIKDLKTALYIKTPEMLYENMTVLEYLMFASRHLKKISVLSHQSELFELLTDVGLGYICLTPIKLLTTEEKMVILFGIGLYSNIPWLIYDFTEYEFSTELLLSMNQLITILKKPDTTLIVGTRQAKLIGICLKDTLFIHNNKIHYCGSVNDLYHRMDRVLYVIKHKDIKELVSQLVDAFPMYEIRNSESRIFIMRKDSATRNDSMFFETLARKQIVPDRIKINHGKMENSFQELIEFNALLK